MSWWGKLLGRETPKQLPKGRLSMADIFANAPFEVQLKDYPKTLYTHTWEKILTETPDRISVELRFLDRRTGEYIETLQFADTTLRGVTEQCNKVIRSRMPKFRKEGL